MNDNEAYLHLIARSLIDQHGFFHTLAVRRARDFVHEHGDALPAVDVALEIARNERRLERAPDARYFVRSRRLASTLAGGRVRIGMREMDAAEAEPHLRALARREQRERDA